MVPVTGDLWSDDYGDLLCAWCGSNPHKPDCKALSRNYGTSLDRQRSTTDRIREEMRRDLDRQAESTMKGYSPAGLPRSTTLTKEPPKDERTEVQKRFDAIAEELEDGKK
jgi:hypothetical protein